ncbi:hypothetical protein GCM10009093_19060 [Brevundimonas terrae]|uniref:Uncharacterized protein n=1 Tax=Brevundimonas terrae TaxID=363631 RepID=A0ABP3I7K9_9CAUL|nr:hypothetical protein [Brevundimonas terrae]NIJ26648.1 hypothetical protein [Brevundimonas terrae]
MGMIFWILVFSVPLFGIVYAGFTSFLKYRQHRAMLDVLKVYAERGEAPPQDVLTALTNGFSLAEEGVNAPNRMPTGSYKAQGPMHYWSLVGLFSVFTAGFAYASWSSGPAGYPFTIVAFTMGAVAVWAMVMAIGLSVRKK